MKKLLLLFAWIVSVSLPALAQNAWMMAAQKDFPVTGSYYYSLIHQEGSNGTTFVTLPYSHTSWSATEAVTVTRKSKNIYEAAKTAFETVGFEKGSADGKYKMYFKKATNSKYYFAGTDNDGYIKASTSSYSAKEVEVEFKYSANGTIHYDGKELQLIDNKFVFAEPTEKEGNKVFLFITKSSYNSNGINSISIKMSTKNSGSNWLDNNISISNYTASTFYFRTNSYSSLDSNIRLVAEGDQPSENYEIANATGQSGTITTLTIKGNATPGIYKFTGYFNYNYEYTNSPVTFTITVKDDMQLVWVYGESNGSLTEINPDGYTVEWNNGQKFFNVAEKDPATGKLTKVHPQTITLSTTTTNGPLSYGNNSTNVKNGYGYGFAKTSSVTYPCEVTYTAVSSLGFSVPDLRLTVTAMKPKFELISVDSFQWQSNGSYEVQFSSPNLSVWSGSVNYITGKLEPAFTSNVTSDSNQADGNFVANMAKATIDRNATGSSTTQGIINITDIPCSGRYNLILRYNGYTSGTKYVDPDYESVIPVNIYPTTDGLKLGIVGYGKDGVIPDNVIYSAPIENGTWTGPKDFEEATETTNSAYRFVELQSDNVAGLTGYYKVGDAAVGTTSTRDAAPLGYSFTDKASGQYMDLFGVNELSLYLAKNGAMTPTPINITLEKSKPVVTGIESVTGDASDAPVEYFNLQGIRVASPEQGRVYIRRQGGAASKIIFSKSN